jgi:hypothetical protein
MDTKQSTLRKLTVLAAAVLACAALPPFLLDRASATPELLPYLNAASLLPGSIGSYALRSRTSDVQQDNEVEQVSVYVNRDSHQIAQVSVLLNIDRHHNGLDCYEVRGIPILWRGTEETQALDSVAYFDVAVLNGYAADSPTGRSLFLVASSECAEGGCAAAPSREDDLFRAALPGLRNVPVSIVLQPAAADAASGSMDEQRDALIRDFRRFVNDLPLMPLRDAAREQAAAAH